MTKLEKLEALAAKKRESIKQKQESLKKVTSALKDIEAEIEILKGEEYMKDINKLDLTTEEFDKFRKYVLSDKNNLLEVIEMLSEEGKKRTEGARPVYE